MNHIMYALILLISETQSGGNDCGLSSMQLHSSLCAGEPVSVHNCQHFIDLLPGKQHRLLHFRKERVGVVAKPIWNFLYLYRLPA